MEAEEKVENLQLTFKLEGFEGPLDLLLHLIKENNMSIMEVKLSNITNQYLEYMKDIDTLDMEQATEFLNVASMLLEIKSKSLLPVETDPNEEEDELDPETQLKMRLEEYKLFKEAGGALHEIENINRFYKQPDKSVGDTRIVFNQFNLEKLLDAFAFLLMRTKDKEAPPEKKINRDRWTVAEKITFLNNVLKEHKQTIATAESCTGGRLAAALNAQSGASDYYMGSVIAYDNSVKTNILGVSQDTLSTDGAVSESTVIEMADGVRKLLQTDYAIATSGIAGPTGGTSEKPVGTVWIAWATPTGTEAQCFHFGASREREQITLRAVAEALIHLIKSFNTKH